MKWFMRAFIVFGVAYLALAAMPPERFWFDPGPVSISDAIEGEIPSITYSRTIKLSSLIQYSVVVRDARGEIACDGGGGPFPYRPTSGPVLGRDLEWWVGGTECSSLPPGIYYGETCWQIIAPMRALLPEWPAGNPNLLKNTFGWLLPPKNVCQGPSVFTIHRLEDARKTGLARNDKS